MLLSTDTEARILRARMTLDGIAVGDAFGQQFFGGGDFFLGF